MNKYESLFTPHLFRIKYENVIVKNMCQSSSVVFQNLERHQFFPSKSLQCFTHNTYIQLIYLLIYSLQYPCNQQIKNKFSSSQV